MNDEYTTSDRYHIAYLHTVSPDDYVGYTIRGNSVVEHFKDKLKQEQKMSEYFTSDFKTFADAHQDFIYRAKEILRNKQ